MTDIVWPDKPRKCCLFCTQYVIEGTNLCGEHGNPNGHVRLVVADTQESG